MLSAISRHLGWKIFLSYLVVILVGVFVLATAAEFAVPRSFNRHMAAMGQMMDSSMGTGMQMGMDLGTDLFTNFRAAVNEALLLAATAAFVVAVLVSIFVTRQVVSPVQEMMHASQRIAEGHYDERVWIPGNLAKDEMDELARLALSFNQMTTRLEDTEKLRRQLIGDVTHELRTPLTTIKGSMEGLIDGVLPAGLETYHQVYREAARLERLVNDLQELSRVEAGAFELDRRSISVAELVDPVLSRLALQFDEKGVGLSKDIPADLPRVWADEDRIAQVLTNLVGNALQYTPPGGKVEVNARELGKTVGIQVRDTGIGIPTEHLPHIFSRFYRVDKSRSRDKGGSGIGLTIAKGLVEAHGGKIWAESPGPGKGSVFQFTLPVG